MNSRPKDPKTARNKNVLVIGGSGSGKTRFWLKPNLMQMHSSYVVTDPKGTILVECGKMLQRGTPKLGKDGKPMKDKYGKVIYEPYRIKVLNTINFKKSMHYNPFAYIHSEKDILKLVTTLIANTKGEGKAGDDFWIKAETLLYAELAEKAAAATAHHNELSAKIKAAEKRMAEIAVLRTHIINYAKTRDTYVAYRKAGYSKKFREAHEEEILLHQAAKNVFDDMGVKKLPKVKELQAEYARLLEEKKMTYAEYRRSREEMRELLAAKANVDRLLNMEAEHDTEREKDHEQR